MRIMQSLASCNKISNMLHPLLIWTRSGKPRIKQTLYTGQKPEHQWICSIK